MGAAGRVVRMARFVGTFVQGFLPDIHLPWVAFTCLNPEAKHLKSPRRRRVTQKTFLAPMAKAAGETIATDQHFPRLVAQAVSQAEVSAVRYQ